MALSAFLLILSFQHLSTQISILKSRHATGTKLFLFRHEGETVACTAIDLFQGGVSHWGLTVAEAHKRRGYSHMVLKNLADIFGNRTLHEQIVIGSVRDASHARNAAIRLVRRERRFDSPPQS